jgi:hypothetical protein
LKKNRLAWFVPTNSAGCLKIPCGVTHAATEAAAVFVIMLMFLSVSPGFAQSFGQRYWTLPERGSFFSLTMGGTNSPPFPYPPYDPINVPFYWLGTTNQWFVFDDSEVPLLTVPDPPGGGGNNTNLVSKQTYDYATNDLWLEIFTVTNDSAILAIHNTKSNYYYQLLTNFDLNVPKWTPGQIVQSKNGTNLLNFAPDPTCGRQVTFYRGLEGFPKVGIAKVNDGIEPNGSDPGVPGLFQVNLSDAPESDLTVQYLISGSSKNGMDYTNLTGSLTITQGFFAEAILVGLKSDTNIEFEESLNLTLVLTNGYVIDPLARSASITIRDNFGTNIFTDVIGIRGPAGIDYHPPTQSLLISFNEADEGEPFNFLQIRTNGSSPDLVVTNWSGIHGLADEVKLATVKTTANGFTAGEMYFGTGVNGIIGRLDPSGTFSNLNWAILTTNTATFETLIRGSLYIDDSGSFGGDLIAVTGNLDNEGGGVWRINSSGVSTQIVNLPNTHLEGVITLTNDYSKYGPWAGKILTGAEAVKDECGRDRPLIYTISTNGSIESFDLGIAPEDFDIIRTNQDLYCIDQTFPKVIKMSHELLNEYSEDILVTQEGPFGEKIPKLFIVHWDSFNSHFVIRAITNTNWFEHVTFAPMNLPSQ